MNRFSKQIFEIPEQYILFTSSELIFLNKKRPIDELFKIIFDSEEIENLKTPLPNEFLTFLNKYGISETSHMLLVIFTNYGLKFNLYQEDSQNTTRNAAANFDVFCKSNNENLEKFSNDFLYAGMDTVNSNYSAGIGERSMARPAEHGSLSNFMRQFKNNECIMKKAFDFYMRLIDCETVVGGNSNIIDKNFIPGIESSDYNAADKDKDLEQLGGVRSNVNIGSREVDNIGRPINDLPNLKINRKLYFFLNFFIRNI